MTTEIHTHIGTLARDERSLPGGGRSILVVSGVIQRSGYSSVNGQNQCVPSRKPQLRPFYLFVKTLIVTGVTRFTGFAEQESQAKVAAPLHIVLEHFKLFCSQS